MSDRSVADQMNRGMFLAPDLDDEGSESPLLAQARADVEEQVEHSHEVEEERQLAADSVRQSEHDRR